MTEDEVDAFWSTHSFGEGLLDQMGPPPEGLLPPPRSERLFTRCEQLTQSLSAPGALPELNRES
ncbi:MAG: hypothetical protein ACR2PL_05950 [Dehalococcoidia bacterium]